MIEGRGSVGVGMRIYGTESASVAASKRALATETISGPVTSEPGDCNGLSCDLEA